MVKSWKTIKKHESSFDRHCARHLYYHIKQNPKEYPSNIITLMDICGIKCDIQSVKNYQRFHAFLVRHRKMTDMKFVELVDSGWFENYLNDGHSDEEIYHHFIDTCLSWEIVPLYCDVDGKYKIIDLPSFLDMKKQRIKATCKEIKTKFESFENTMKVLPDTVNTELNLLKSDSTVGELIAARDKLNKFLPESKETKDGS